MIEREGAAIGVPLNLTELSKPMITKAVDTGQYRTPGLAGAVPCFQIVTVEQALALCDRALRLLPALWQDSFKRATGMV